MKRISQQIFTITIFIYRLKATSDIKTAVVEKHVLRFCVKIYLQAQVSVSTKIQLN